LKHTFRHIADGATVIESDLIVCPDYEWPMLAESKDPEWSVLIVGAEVLALRLRGVPSVISGVSADSTEFSILPPR
jgi:hypothetical protein